MKDSLNIKRSRRIRKKLKKYNSDRVRLTVFRSSKNISAQIIDDKSNKTLITATSNNKKKMNKKKNEMSLDVASSIIKMASEKKIKKVYFDRGKYKYHGRIKFFADALRKGGLVF